MVRFGIHVSHVSVCTHIVAGCAAARLVVGSISIRLVMAVSAESLEPADDDSGNAKMMR